VLSTADTGPPGGCVLVAVPYSAAVITGSDDPGTRPG